VCVLYTVHICDVPLQDILRTGGLLADNTAAIDGKHDKQVVKVLKDKDRTTAAEDKVDKTSDKSAAADGKHDKQVVVLKDKDRTAAVEDKVDKTSDKPKKTRSSLDADMADADDRTKRNISDDKIRRRRRRSSEVRGNSFVSEGILSSPVEGADTPMSQTAPTSKGMVSDKGHRRRRSRNGFSSEGILSSPVEGADTPMSQKQPTSKGMVSDKERKRRRSRLSDKVMNVPVSQPDNLSYGSGTTYPARADASYGSEAVEDVIQRLLDNDELMDDADQPPITSPPSTTTSTVSAATATRRSAPLVSPDRRRSREVTKKSGKSPRPGGQTSASAQVFAKLPGSVSQPSVKSPLSAVQKTSVNRDTTGRPSDTTSDTDDTLAAERSSVSSGPRIKHVCRYASIALGKPVATFPPVSSSQLQLSALPSQEKERILVEKSPGMYPQTASYLYFCYY